MLYEFDGYLVHHGILGQKWGVRNGPPYPLDQDDHSARERRAGWKSSLRGSRGKPDAARRRAYSGVDSAEGLGRASTEQGDRRTTQRQSSGYRVSASKKTSGSRLDPDNIPDERGITPAQYKRARKILIAVGAGALVGAGAYAFIKYKNMNADKIIKAGTDLQRITNDGNVDLNDMFYATPNKLDFIKYKGEFAGVARSGLSGEDVFKSMLSSNKDLKIAGVKSAEKIFKNLLETNEEFAKAYGARGYEYFNRNGLAMGVDRVTKLTFDGQMPNRYAEANKIFLKALADNGYSGVIDMNDMLNGYDAKLPVILLKDAGEIFTKSVEQMSIDEIQKNYDLDKIISAYKTTMRTVLPTVGAGAVGVGATGVGMTPKKNKRSTRR